jgi:hypothetical protein
MNRIKAAAPLLILLAMTSFVSRLFAQPPVSQQTLVGTWTLVLVDNVLPDGSRTHLYGEQPRGILMFDAGGRYALQIFSAGRPRFAANDKSKGTPEEYKAAMQGSNAHFGRYTVHDNGAITFHIEHASFPNWEGTEQKRSFTLTGDELKYLVPTPTTGGNATGEVVWKRTK